MLRAVITSVPSQKFKVDRLVKYCLDLDGTVVKVVNVDDSKFSTPYRQNEFACKQAYTLRCAALEMKGAPFFWLESDSIPLKAGWLSRIETEYKKGGKTFMLSSDSHPPHDLVGGIGVYSGDTHWIVPRDVKQFGWDRWMIDHIKQLIHFTPLVQHSYGIYEGGHVKQEHRFPRDLKMLRPEAEIFHRDKHQDLIPGKMRSFYHTGDIGDIIAALPVIRHLGGGDLIIGDAPIPGQQIRESMQGRRYDALAPLVRAAVPYVTSVQFVGGPMPAVDYDLSTFRQTNSFGQNLAEWQARHLGITNLDQSKWLEVTPSAESRGKVVIARSPRYHNPQFNWRRILDANRNSLLFIGLPDEHALFKRDFGYVPYRPTEDMLQVAELIAGSSLFVGNQSAPMWTAMALAHDLVQESWAHAPNSIVTRPNAQFIFGNSDRPRFTQSRTVTSRQL
jgi:hypothetical protein